MDNHVCILQVPDESRLFDYIKANASMSLDMVTHDTRLGKSVVICGAGPSLADEYRNLPLATEVWACNSALPYLIERGVRVTHGLAIDQSEGMLEDWRETFDVTYLLASSVNPKLVAHLKGRRLRFFHSYLGIPDPEGESGYELSLYKKLYPDSVQVGHGLNSVPRAVCLALAMGFTDIKVYGADCAAQPNQREMPETGEPGYFEWMQGVTLYADGRSATVYGESVMCEAVIDDKRWTTRPDMIISAQWLVRLQQAFPDRITLVGDTLPNALMGKDDAFWAASPVLGDGSITNIRTMKEVAA